MAIFSLAAVFGAGMVLQREREITVWGTGINGETVTVHLQDDVACCIVKNETWRCILVPRPAQTGLTLYAEHADQCITIHNVFIGDVWLAAGQSNMEFNLKYEKHWPEVKDMEINSLIRMYNCPRIAFEGQQKPQEECGYWFSEGDIALEKFSAVGYWFARRIQPQAGVPVGIIACNWGGTSASAWIDRTALQDEPLNIYEHDYKAAILGKSPEELRKKSFEGWKFLETAEHKAETARIMYGLSRKEQEQHRKSYAKNPTIPIGPYHKNCPGALYTYMLKPIIPFSLKGVLWYQGENDEHHAPLYSRLFTTLISCWRRDFENPTLPFLFVQLAAFEKWMQLDGKNFPAIREQQEMVLHSVTDCAMVCTMDIGMRYDIHPKEKRQIGFRLADSALVMLYGKKLICDSPELIEAKRYNHEIILSFSNCGNGICRSGRIHELFRVSQRGKQLCIREIRISKNKLILKTGIMDDEPVEVSFARVPYAAVKISNSAGLPMKPFKVTV